MRRFIVIVLGACATAGVAIACGAARMEAPPYVGHPTSALAPAPYPPPPARVELVPAEPDTEGAVWIDGEWTWQGRRWSWKRGRWVLPPAGAAYAPWTMTRDATGTVFVAEGRWRDANGNEIAEPEPLAEGGRRFRRARRTEDEKKNHEPGREALPADAEPAKTGEP